VLAYVSVGEAKASANTTKQVGLWSTRLHLPQLTENNMVVLMC